MPDQHEFDDQPLTRYLLGTLPEDEAERLDELAVVDDDVAVRLRVIENDLVDAYVRGEMPLAMRAPFERSYLASPARREKVATARALASIAARRADADAPVASPGAAFRTPAFFAIAAAAALVLAIAGAYLVITPRDSLPAVRRAIVPAPTAQRGHRNQPPAVLREQQRKVVSLLLLPPLRGAAAEPELQIPSGTEDVEVQLQLESDDFPQYRATLRDLSGDTNVWSSGTVGSVREKGVKIVRLTLPAAILRPQHYSIDLNGVPAEGKPETIGSYAFRVAASIR